MSLTDLEITHVLAEIEAAVGTGWIQRVFQPGARTLVFEIRVPGRTHRLLVSCQPECTRLHLVTSQLRNPPSPPAFCQYLRAHIQGARIDGFHQIPGDRIVEWRLTTKEGPRTVLCELTGRQANLYVLDSEGVILKDLSGDRALIGKHYRPPDRPDRTGRNQISRFSIHDATGNRSISAAIEQHYQDREASATLEQAKDLRRRALKKTIQKARRRIEAWREDLAKATRFREYARYGELLKANLGMIRKGMNQVLLTDYFDPAMPEISLPLDGTKSAQGNMEDYFRKYRKYLAAQQELQPRIAQAEQDLEGLRQELVEIEQGTWSPSITESSHGPFRPSRRAEARQANQRRAPFKRFVSADGLTILVGRNATENEELTFGLANSDDLWLHARGVPGSHVVVRMEKGKDAPPATLLDAATLALLYSDLKKSGKGEIIYTRRKWVKKAKNQAPGTVLVTREQALTVRLDHTRLANLKDRSREKT
ncbi:MAG TPA: NFACT RNA binding domain-containing protein [Nitrospira sp.]|nr:NFACT RNA binding domain-containing protein [Nitrospira sp.]